MADSQIQETGITSRLLDFVHHLREASFNVTAEDAGLMSRSLVSLPEPDIRLSRASFRALCCQNANDWSRFDRLFNDFWLRQEDISEDAGNSLEIVSPPRKRGGIAGISGGAEAFHEFISPDEAMAAGAGRQTTLSKADFRFLGDRHAMSQVEVLAENLAKSIRPIRSRRRVISRKKGQLALGATLRSGVRTGGMPVVPRYAVRKKEPPGLVILHDVSHSMTFNNPMLVRFTRGLIKRFRHGEIFVFHTRLYPVTSIFRESSVSRMRSRLEEGNRLWLGGTCIADSLEEFRQSFARKTLKSDARLIIISDGFDSNEPQRLAEELTQLRRFCRKVIWLNPMLEREGFNPEKEEVWNIKSHVDALLPAHSLDSLRRVIPIISK